MFGVLRFFVFCSPWFKASEILGVPTVMKTVITNCICGYPRHDYGLSKILNDKAMVISMLTVTELTSG